METWKNKSLINLEGEIWKDVVGYEGVFMVSNLDRVKSLDRWERSGKGMVLKIRKSRILSVIVSSRGYLKVTLQHNKKKKYGLVHRLKAEAFIPNPLNLPQINHKNGVKTDNRIDLEDLYGDNTNIEWCNPSQNQQHAYDTGLNPKRFALDHPNGKLSDEDCLHIIAEYKKWEGKRDKRPIREELCKKYGISDNHFKQVALGHKRPHLHENPKNTDMGGVIWDLGQLKETIINQNIHPLKMSQVVALLKTRNKGQFIRLLKNL